MVAVDSKEISIWANILQRIEIFLWVLNQACIGFVTIYMFWACISRGMGTMQLHAFLVTLGVSTTSYIEIEYMRNESISAISYRFCCKFC